MSGKKTMLMLLILLFVFFDLKAQIARLAVTRGTTVNFIFDTLSEYNNGISYPNWTAIAVYFDDQSTGLKWKLEFESTSPTIVGNGSNTIDLNVIRVSASNGGFLAATNYYGNLFLENNYQTLVSGGNSGNTLVNIVNISYDAGVINSLKNIKPDYYAVDIHFLVSVQ